MRIDIVVPQAGESVTEAMIGSWYKGDGEHVDKDETLVELETDKSNLELVADQAGKLTINAVEGAVVQVGDIIGFIEVGEEADQPSKAESEPAAKAAAKPAQPSKPAEPSLSPAVRRIVEEEKLDVSAVSGTGKDGRITKGDALQAAKKPEPKVEAKPEPAKAQPAPKKEAVTEQSAPGQRSTRAVPMSMLRRRIAQRLVEAQRSAAILTTFNEVDMTAVMNMRKTHQEDFQKKHGIKLGFMSFFIRACVDAIKTIPEINAKIEDQTIIYHDYIDVGVAVGSERGLIVPVIRDTQNMGFAEIESTIADYGRRAKEGRISLDELTGGTFTISNGGIYGSLLSTPILNPPQSGILGMHKIEKRAVVDENDQIVVRPMMYLALSYDHRIVDGKEAVSFLVKVKQALEDPARMLLEI